MRVIHYDGQTAPRQIEVKSLKIVDGFYVQTEKGLLMAATVFPLEQAEELLVLWYSISAARETVKQLEVMVHTILNASSAWRKGV